MEPAIVSAIEPFPVDELRRDFPILSQEVHGKPLVYLDNAATSQKPEAVIQALDHYYRTCNANVHRGVHALSLQSTILYEAAREKVASFLGADSMREIVFVRGATEGINLVAHSFVAPRLGEGDEILVSAMEHHSNIVPWQLLCEEKGAQLRVIPMDEKGDLDLEAYGSLLNEKTRLVGVVHVSNALGTVNPVERIVELAHEKDIPVLVDGAQAAPHLRVDVGEIGCDFYVISGHKALGPTGIGALWGRPELLQAMRPYQGGGEMIRSVTFGETLYAEPPARFEAGTPNIAGAIGLGAALDYLTALDFDAMEAYEEELTDYAIAELLGIEGLRLIGEPARRAGVISFVLEGLHPHDIGTVLDREGVAIRTGHHCAQPVMEFFGIPATARASLAFYNTRAEIDALVAALGKTQELFSL